MKHSASRYSLLALAIAAAIPAHAAPIADDHTCTASSGNSIGCDLSSQIYNTVTIEQGTTLEGTVSGARLSNSSLVTLNNAGAVSGGYDGIEKISGNIGTLTNSGTISSDTRHGIYNSSGTITTLTNTATGIISGGTTESSGIHNFQGTIGTLTNSGEISGQTGVSVNTGTLSTLNNSGLISGVGTGIFYEEAGDGSTINNSGTISGNDAIDVHNTDIAINNSGDILASSAAGTAIAVQGSSNSSLRWSAGRIRGSIGGVDVEVSGNVNYDAHFNAAGINVTSGSSLTLEHEQMLSFGRLTLAENASLDLYLSSTTPLTNGDSDFAIVKIFSDVAFGDGSQIGLRVSGSDFAADQSTYTLLHGNNLFGNGLSVVARDSALLQVDNYWIENNTVYATVTTLDSYEFAGNTPNGQRAGNTILPMLSGLASHFGNDPVLNALAGDSEQVRRTVEELVPQVNGGVLHAANNLHHQAALNAGQRTQGLRGASAGDTFAERGLWLKVLDSDADQDERDNVEGFNADTSGLAIGADGKLNDQLTLGLAYSYQNTDTSSDSGNQTDIDGHAITLYSGYEQGAWFVDSSLTLGLNHNDSERYIAGTTAKADYDSKLLGLNLLTGYGLQLDNGLLLEPRAAARYGRIDIDGFREKGSVAALQVSSQRFEIAELGAGLRLAGSTALGNGTLEPEARVMAYHDFAADRIDTTANFVFGGSSFAATGASPARTRYEAGVGVDYKLDALTLGLSYDYTSKEDFNADTFQAKVRYDF